MTHQTPEPAQSAPVAPHPSVDQLADLHEELLEAADAAAVREHLVDCPHCAETLDALAGLTELLGAEEPPPMPEDVALRIDAALAAEADAAEAADARAAALPTPAPTPSRAPLAAPPTRKDRHTPPGRPAARRRARLLLATASCLAVLGLGAVVLNSLGSTTTASSSASAARPAGSAPQLADAARGPVFTPEQLPDQIHQLLATRSPAAGSLPHAASEKAPADGTTTALPSCVRSAVGDHAGDTPLAVGHGRLSSAPVDVYVFPTTADPTRLDVYLLSPGCSVSPSQLPATVLLHQVVPAS